MKIPVKIQKALDLRCEYAYRLTHQSIIVDEFIIKNHIEVEECDFLTGVEMYSNPYDSCKRITEAIRNHKEVAL